MPFSFSGVRGCARRYGVIAVAVVLLTGTNPLSLSSSNLQAQVSDTVPAMLLNGISALASQHPTPGVAWVAFCSVPPRLLGIFDGERVARQRATSAGPRCGVVAIQVAGPTEDRAIPATLAGRLAEAADGNRTGATLWFVAEWAFPHHILGPYPTQALADAVASDSAPGYGTFGPYVAPLDFGRETVFRPMPHCLKTSWFCEVLGLPETPLPISSIDSLTVSVWQDGERVIGFRADPDSIDAIFLTLPAMDKFMFPYYTNVLGVEWTAQLRESIREYVERLPVR